MPSTRLRPIIAGAAATAIAVTVAGCGSDDESTESATTQPSAVTTDAGAASSDATTTGGASGAATDGAYRDGDYSADGSYQSPGGTESVGVALTLKDGTVTKLTVTSKAKHPNSKNFQAKFISGIDAEVVGKPIDDLQVDKVAGSSLTSGGFNQAIDAIKAEAAG